MKREVIFWLVVLMTFIFVLGYLFGASLMKPDEYGCHVRLQPESGAIPLEGQKVL